MAFACLRSHKGLSRCRGGAPGRTEHPDQRVFGRASYIPLCQGAGSQWMGAGDGADRRTGLEVEITSLANPYLDGAAGRGGFGGGGHPTRARPGPAASWRSSSAAPGGRGDGVHCGITDAQGRATVPVRHPSRLPARPRGAAPPEPGLGRRERQAVVGKSPLGLGSTVSGSTGRGGENPPGQPRSRAAGLGLRPPRPSALRPASAPRPGHCPPRRGKGLRRHLPRLPPARAPPGLY